MTTTTTLAASPSLPHMLLLKEQLKANNTAHNYVAELIARRARARSFGGSSQDSTGSSPQGSPSSPSSILPTLSDKQLSNLHAEQVEALAEKAIERSDLKEVKLTLLQRLEAKRKQQEETEEAPAEAIIPIPAGEAFNPVGESFALSITLNDQQLAAKEMALLGKSFCLIGAAGTGKTTTQREVARQLLLQDTLQTTTVKTYNAEGARQYKTVPSIAFCAYTRRAAANLAKAIHKDPELKDRLADNIMTIHTLLEYEPETYFDPVENKDRFRFAPMRTASNPLTITHLVIEEASMLGLDLWDKLYDAMPPNIQIIFIGDINQLPPVFGPSILNYALTQLPIVELTQVYRNQGIVLENAHNILAGKPLVETEHYQIIRGKSAVQVGQAKMAASIAKMFETLSETTGYDGLPTYDAENDIILSPFNKQDLGTDNMNRWIAQFVGAKRNAVVHEIIAGFNKLYLAEGDKVMVNKRDGIITKIERNSQYHGKEPQLPGTDLTRFGVRIIGAGDTHIDLDELSLDYSNFSVGAIEEERAARVMQASHKITVLMDEGRTEELTAAGDFQAATFSLGYVLTVHKSQGSEWRKVFIFLHKDHSVMLFRELLYTAATRARTDIAIIAKDFVITKAIATQRIKGNTLKDKLAFFNSGINDAVDVQCIKTH